MKGQHGPQGIFDANSTKEMIVVANGELTAGCPAGYYYDANGVATAIKVAVDVNSIRWGITPETIATGATGRLITSGPVVLASGGTAGQLITAISNAGAITDAAAANTNADINVLGVSTSATAAILF